MKTLKQRIGEGPIPIQEGLRYAALLAEALRKVHDDGRSHGSVTPDRIELSAVGLDLLPAGPGIIRITPYSAPEVAADGKPADTRSDIFSFGAVVFETLTGRKAFDRAAKSPAAAPLREPPTPQFGSPAIDRLLEGCLAKDPAARWQRIQDVQLELRFLMPSAAPAPRQRQRTPKVQVELKVSSAATRRASSLALAPHAGLSSAASGAELAEFEARINAKLQAHEKVVADIQRSTGEAVTTLREQLSALGAQLAISRNQGAGGDLAPAIEAAGERIVARVQRGIEALTARVTFLEKNHAASAEFRTHFETGLSSLRDQFSELHTHIAADLHEFELNLKAQSSAIDSARTAMAQTDDLVERVVEALESLQSTVLEQSEDGVMALT